MQAYLVISQGSRWTDIFRLQPGEAVVIGRSSDNQIVIRDDRASRRHAEIAYRDGAWVVRDLGSRNGTQLNQRVLADEHFLADGDSIVVAGCRMTFVLDLAHAFHPSPGAAPPLAGQVSSAQTIELGDEPPTIVERRTASRWSRASGDGESDAVFLYRLIFDLVAIHEASQLAQCALDRLLGRIGIHAGGVVMIDRSQSGSKPPEVDRQQTVLAAKQASGQAYHRVSDFLVASVLRDSQAVLARNVQMDAQLSLARESGQRQTSSIICAPLSDKGQVVGLLHVYTSLDERMLTDADLELAVAVADNLALALAQLRSREQLSQSLATSRRKIDQLERELGQHNEMVGKSPAIERVRRAIERSAPTNATVLIRGESGVGKELVARAIHMRSSRREGPLVCLNCAALAPTLLESELFGHEKGAFTGATERKIGKFEAANGGTLLLDEIGEMSPELQAKFLRVLEGQPFERLGGNKPIQTSVRVIAATNRDLEQAVRDKQFRSDLYFRLRVIEIDVPPLRERLSDVPLLAEHFLETFRQHADRRIDGFAPETFELLSHYSWPGNIRELRNVIERAVVLGGGSTIEPEDVSLAPLAPVVAMAAQPAGADGSPPNAYRPITLDQLEQEHILATLEALGGNKSRAAAVLGVERSTLDRKLKRYDMQRGD
ncbi:MAG: sigma 54-interacting transcriptional regulator [Aureliella sp.]